MKSFLFKHIISRVYNLIFSIKLQPQKLEIKQGERCLLLAAKTEDIFSAAGGTVLLNRDKFNVYALTNGFRQIINSELTYEEKVSKRKEEFETAMEKSGIIFGEFFDDIDDGRLVMRYDKFKSVILSNYDYIFIPNILELDKDNRSIALLLEELLKERPYKRHAKIVFYEISSPLAMTNCYVDIEDIAENKKAIINSLNNNSKTNFAQKAMSLNEFRGTCIHKNYAEAFCVVDVNEFKKICRLYR